MNDEPKLGVRAQGRDGTWYLLDISGVAFRRKDMKFCVGVDPELWLEWLRGAVIEPGPGTDCLDA